MRLTSIPPDAVGHPSVDGAVFFSRDPVMAAAGIRIECVLPGDGRIHGGMVALPVEIATGRTNVVLTLARRDDGPWMVKRDFAWSNVPPIREALALGTVDPARSAGGEDFHLMGLLDGDPARLRDECRDVFLPSPESVRHAEDTTDVDCAPPRDRKGYTTGPSGYCTDLRHHVRTLRELGYSHDAGPSAEPDPRLFPAMDRAVAGWVAAMAAMVSPHGPSPLRLPTCSVSALSDLADPAHGKYRLQAVSLYPAFAPFLVGNGRPESIAPLVDGGKPFGRELARCLEDWVLLAHPGTDPTFDGARMRRFRTMPGTPWGRDVSNLLAVSAGLPPERLPDTPAGWESMASHARALERFCRRTGLPMAHLVLESMVRGGSAMDLMERLADVMDMVKALARTLVEPCRGAFDPWIDSHKDRRVAGRLMFAGASLRAILDASERWHLHGAAPVPSASGSVTWPALFPAFDAPNGIRIECLTTPSQLAAEGSPDRDAAGIPGLSHCVGTYADPCATGRVHVASLHRVDGAGRKDRISTASFAIEGLGGVPRAAVEQHRGRANAAPALEAVEAIAALMAHLKGRPLPDAVTRLAMRPAEKREIAEEDLPGMLATWNPFLPRARRIGSVDALRAIVSELRAEDIGP
jgi:hypothetical protein